MKNFTTIGFFDSSSFLNDSVSTGQNMNIHQQQAAQYGGNFISRELQPTPPPPPPPPPPGWDRTQSSPIPPPPPAPTGRLISSSPVPPPPPVPTGKLVDTGQFRVVPSLGHALHQAKLKISGMEETPACSEGTSTGDRKNYTSSRPKSWCAGKQLASKALLGEMQNKLAARRAKVDKEGEIVTTPDIGKPPMNQRPASCVDPLNMSNFHPNDIYKKSKEISPEKGNDQRRLSRDSGCFIRDGRSLTPLGTAAGQPAYRRVSVDLGRKEELVLAKQVRQTSVKILRQSPVPMSERSTANPSPSFQQPLPQPLPPPSPVVMRYWNQCTHGNSDESSTPVESNNQVQSDNGEVLPPWKQDALEGDTTEFPSIKSKIKSLEEESNKPALVNRVPDIRKNLNINTTPKGWMETKQKLQAQLDTLLTKTTEKMSLYAKYRNPNSTESPNQEERRSETPSDLPQEAEAKQAIQTAQESRPPMNDHMKMLIKSVANEIQKSFSVKNFDDLAAAEEDENYNNQESELENAGGNKQYWSNMVSQLSSNGDEAAQREEQRHAEDDQQPSMLDIPKQDSPPRLESPVGFDSPIACTLDASVARDKAKIARKSSQERRLPACVLAKRKAAEKLKNILSAQVLKEQEENSPKDQADELANEPKNVDREECKIKAFELHLDEKTDEEKAEFLARQMSKLESDQILQILQSVEKGVLDISIPVLIPYLSLQVKINLSKSLCKDLKREDSYLKENIMEGIIDDITDIALLQEVIERSQERLSALTDSCDASNEKGNEKDLKDATTLTDHEYTCERFHPKIQFSDKSTITSEKSPSPTPRVASPVAPALDELDADASINEQDEASVSSEHRSDDEGIACSDPEGDVTSEDEKSDKIADHETSPKTAENDTSEREVKVWESKPTTETIAKSKSEKDLKNKILDIIKEAKAQEDAQRGNQRNFGRNFEYLPLKTVIPNDRRPAKAKRMDDMWCQNVARRQGIYNYNGLETAKPAAGRSPWSMKNNSGVKKDSMLYNQEVEEFDKCRSNLKSGATAKGKEDQSADKKSSEPTYRSKYLEKEKENEAKKLDEEAKKDKVTSEEKKKIIAEKDNNNISATQNSKESAVFDISTQLKVLNDVEQKAEDNTKPDGQITPEENVHKNKPVLTKSVAESTPSVKSDVEKQSTVLKPSVNERSSEPVTDVKQANPPVVKTDSLVPPSPMTRRRMETISSSPAVPPPASSRGGAPPPPPSFRPPPPPMSPPTAPANESSTDEEVSESESEAASIASGRNDSDRNDEDISNVDESNAVSAKESSPIKDPSEKEGSEESVAVIAKEDEQKSLSETEKEDEDEEEGSEWTWTEEEIEVDYEDESWENILSSSDGPVTYNGEFSVKITC